MGKALKETMGWADWSLMFLLATIWGGSFFFVAVALESVSVMGTVALRLLMAAASLWIFVLVTRQRIPSSPRVWFGFLPMGLLNNVIPFSLIVWGQSSIPSGLASILNATTPLFTVLVAGCFLADERITARKVLGILCGVVGVATLMNPGVLADWEGGVLPRLAVLGAAVSYGFAGTYGRRFGRMGVPPPIAALGQLTVSSALATAAFVVLDEPGRLLEAGGSAWASLLALATVSTAFAYLIYFRLLDAAGATNISLVTLLAPVSAVLLGISFLGETLETEHLTGMAFIAFGLTIIDGRPWKALKKRLAAK